MDPVTASELDAALPHLRSSPRQVGSLAMIVCRPDVDRRDVVDEGKLDLELGLVGDNWATRGSRSTPDGSADPDRQITVMNARFTDLVARTRDRWPLAGDQLYVEFDLSLDNLPAGSELRIGSAVIEVTQPPHTGCQKFSKRFGPEALRFVNSPEGRALRLRGINAKVVQAGVVRTGDAVTRL